MAFFLERLKRLAATIRRSREASKKPAGAAESLGELQVYTAIHAMVFVAMADGDLNDKEISGIDLALRRISASGLPEGLTKEHLRPFGKHGLEEREGFLSDRELLSAKDREDILLLALLIGRVSPSPEGKELQRVVQVAVALDIPHDKALAIMKEHGPIKVTFS